MKLLWHDRGEGIVGVHPFIIMVIVVVVVIVRSVGVVVAVMSRPRRRHWDMFQDAPEACVPIPWEIGPDRR